MDRALRRRLDALIVICSGIFGMVLMQLLPSQPFGPRVLLFALFPTAVVMLLAFMFVESSTTTVSNAENSPDH